MGSTYKIGPGTSDVGHIKSFDDATDLVFPRILPHPEQTHLLYGGVKWVIAIRTCWPRHDLSLCARDLNEICPSPAKCVWNDQAEVFERLTSPYRIRLA